MLAYGDAGALKGIERMASHEEVNLSTLVKVCGAGRSGTTMLDLMLGNAEDAFSCGEVYAKFRPWLDYHYRAECRCGQHPCPVWQEIGPTSEREFHTAVFSKLGVRFVIDSSKELCWLIDAQDWAVSNGIRVINLLLWKDPINLAYSHWKRGGGLMFWRRSFLSYYGKFLDTGLPFRSVYFNDLVGNPQRKLKDICAAMGMSYREGQERFWEKQHHYLFGSQGAYEQVVEKRSAIRGSETFPPEFDVQVDALSGRIARDRKIQRILETLHKTEISSKGGLSSDDQAFLPRRPRPVWYYALKARQVARRYFPNAPGLGGKLERG